MGQIYTACVYDTKKRIAYTGDVDKFHANCHSNSGSVVTTHYLLRQQPYNVMWGGGYVVIDDFLEQFDLAEHEDLLLGISTYEDLEGFTDNNENVEQLPYYDKIKFIDDNSKTWQRKNIWHGDIPEKALKYFDHKTTLSVLYTGYLLNHTQKLAVDLADYHKKSLYMRSFEPLYEEPIYDVTVCIDAVPVLACCGGNAQMAYLNGVSAESTPQLATTWTGDLLQIVDELPKDFTLIDCCFADIWDRANYCYKTFGTNEDGIIKDKNGLYKATPLTLFGNQGSVRNVKVEIEEITEGYRKGRNLKFRTVEVLGD
ncbi:MAG: hypothetical protein FWG63_09700 [Defluviitaleaceae bacterium]|nr:hypothetical protein [Defluviitaleaceae bacterium]